MASNRSGQKRVEVWVDEAAYAQALAGKPRGWLTEQVRSLLEKENDQRAEPALIDFGAADENPALVVGPITDDLSKTTVVGDSMTGIKPERHLFRRGELHAETRHNGNVERTYLCACGCGEIR